MPAFTIDCPYSVGDNVFVIYTYNKEVTCDVCNGKGSLTSAITQVTYGCKHCRNGVMTGAERSVVCPAVVETVCITQEKCLDTDEIKVSMIFFLDGKIEDPDSSIEGFGCSYREQDIYLFRDDAAKALCFRELCS